MKKQFKYFKTLDKVYIYKASEMVIIRLWLHYSYSAGGEQIKIL